jgi:hypothetical protein
MQQGFPLSQEDYGIFESFAARSASSLYTVLLAQSLRPGFFLSELFEMMDPANARFAVCSSENRVLYLFTDPGEAILQVLRIQCDYAAALKEHGVKFCFHSCSPLFGARFNRDMLRKELDLAATVIESAPAAHIYSTQRFIETFKPAMLFGGVGIRRHGVYSFANTFAPLPVYEIYCRQTVAPRGLLGGKKRNETVPVLFGVFLASILVLVAVSMGVVLFQTFTIHAPANAPVASGEPAPVVNAEPAAAPEAEAPTASVFFRGLYFAYAFLDGHLMATSPVEGSPDLVKCLSSLEPGRHIIHIDLAPQIRYYSEFDVVSGENTIGLKFIESDLASIEEEYVLTDEKAESLKTQKNFVYTVYDPETKEKKTLSAAMSLEIGPHKEDKKALAFSVVYSLNINGEKKVEKELVIQPVAGSGDADMVPVRIYEEASHYYDIRYTLNGSTLKFGFGAYFQ